MQFPPDPPDPTFCSAQGDVCLTASRQMGHCLSEGGGLSCSADVAECSGCEQSCRVEGVTGVCTDGPGPEGSCGACDPLPAPLCSALRDVATAPLYCEEAPHWDEKATAEAGLSMRQACAPLRAGEAWQCSLETPECPAGMQKCYWDGKWGA